MRTRLGIRRRLVFVGALLVGAPLGAQAVVTGVGQEWRTTTLTFDSPIVTSESDAQNPFRDYRLNVRFTRPDQSTLDVPGFYAADGDAAETSADAGSKWMVRLLPDQCGTWGWEASFRTGADIAAELDFDSAGSPVAASFDGTSGTFDVEPANPGAAGFWGKGLLRDVGGHHLQFAENHEYFLKGGADSPEDFLGYHEFDGTFDLGGVSPATPDGLHHYDPHLGDFDPTDPLDQAALWQGGKGKGIVGAVDYLASKGVNSIYFLTYSSDGGDSQDTWVWRDPSGFEHKLRFDVSKLDQWERIFRLMDARGVQLHVVMQEIENDQVMGALTLERKLYFRELVARFAHHPALLWNIGEENSSPSAEQIAFADQISALDPYDHPITVHTGPGQAYATYGPLYGTSIGATSIQGSPAFYNSLATSLRNLSRNGGRAWPIFGDEQFSPSVNQSMNNVPVMRQDALWGNLIGGGAGVEWYFSFGDVTTEDFRIAGPLWDSTRPALGFFQEFVNVPIMRPNNAATPETDDYVLEEDGETYVVYRKAAGVSTVLVPDREQYTVRWFDPRSGGTLKPGSLATFGGSPAQPSNFEELHPSAPGSAIGAPPYSPELDWVALVRKKGNRPPRLEGITVEPTPLVRGGPLSIQLHCTDPDGPNDIRAAGLIYFAPGASNFDGTVARYHGGDLYTIYQPGTAGLPLGLWSYTALVVDKSGAVDAIVGSFTVVP